MWTVYKVTHIDSGSEEERRQYSERMVAHYATSPKLPESDETRRRKSEAAVAYWECRRAAVAAGQIAAVGHKPHANSDDTRLKISAGLKRAYEEGRRVTDRAEAGI